MTCKKQCFQYDTSGTFQSDTFYGDTIWIYAIQTCPETVNKPVRMKNKIKVVVTADGIEYDTIITKIFPVFLPTL